MSTDNVDSLLTQLHNEVETGKKFGRLRLVDPAVMQDLLESVRASMPNTIERAKEIVARRAEILDQAQQKAAAVADQARQNLAESEATGAAIVAEAQQKADESEASANARIQDAVQRAKQSVLQKRTEGEQIVAEAHEEAVRLVSEHSITVVAQEQAEQMLRQAREAAEQVELDSRQQAEQRIAQARDYHGEMTRATQEWGVQYTAGVRSVVEEIVGESEEILSASLTDIRNTQKRLQTTLSKSAGAPEFRGPEEPSLY
ncbi:MAG: hypothetical protein LBB75_08910 [Oscillospiraceae bacterium]|jgi:hypothetical protein|nr:hypothetical protein [Oscillospiraceae bacterium]